MIDTVLTLFAGFATAAHLATTGLVMVRLARRGPPAATGTPFITLLRPACGLDSHDAETLGSSFTQNYPAYEVVFCVARDDDPVVPLLRDLMARHPKVPSRLLLGEDAVSANPKLNNLHKGWVQTTARWVAMADSNLLLPPDYLQTLLSSWQAGTGLVSAPPVGIRPQGMAASLECAFLNGNQARLQLAADSLGVGFAQGKTLFWRRDLLAAQGGLVALGKDLAEDAASTKLVRRLGLRVTLTPAPFAQPIGKRSLRTVWDRQLRWSRVRRDGFASIFLAEPLNGPVLPALALGLASGPLPALAMLGLWYLAEACLLRIADWPRGWRDLAAMPLRDALVLPLWVATFARRGITWRGTAMVPPAIGTANQAGAGLTPAQ